LKSFLGVFQGFSREPVENPEEISQIFLILRWTYAPKVALSNGENPNSIAANGAELFSE
jgi:hypothetical protein